MVHMELIARITAVETVRVIILVTKEPELALNALLDGKINIVTKVRKLNGKTVWNMHRWGCQTFFDWKKHLSVKWVLFEIDLLQGKKWKKKVVFYYSLWCRMVRFEL